MTERVSEHATEAVPERASDRRGRDRRLVERRGQRAAAGAPAADQVLRAVCAEPWAITEDGLERVLAVVSRAELFPDALAAAAGRLEALDARAGRPVARTDAVTVRDGVATLRIDGTLQHKADFFTAFSGGATYEGLAQDLHAALDAPEVRALLLDVDSPGGEVAGCADLATMIAQAAQRVPVAAFVGGEGCSAGYWLAAAAGEVWAASTALVGCLGVRMSMVDSRERDATRGVTRLEFVSSQTPDKALDPATDTGRGRVQRIVDDMAAVFLRDVTAYRAGALGAALALDPAALAADAVNALAAEGRAALLGRVAQQYGAGEVFVGQAAVDRGLADRVGTYEQLHAALAAGQTRPLRSPPAAGSGGLTAPRPRAVLASSSITEPTMATTADPKPAATAATEPAADESRSKPSDPAEPKPAEPKAVDPPADETPAAAVTRLRAEGAAAERTRVLGILDLSAHAGLPTLRACIDDAGCSADAAAARVLKAGADAGRGHLGRLAGDEAALAAAGGVKGQAEGRPAAEETLGQRIARTHAHFNPGRSNLAPAPGGRA